MSHRPDRKERREASDEVYFVFHSFIGFCGSVNYVQKNKPRGLLDLFWVGSINKSNFGSAIPYEYFLLTVFCIVLSMEFELRDNHSTKVFH